MDNPISWGILFVLAIIAAIWFFQKCEAELTRNRAENDWFFEKKEIMKKWEEK